MPLPQENLYTLEDIYDLPNGERAELLDGRIYYMAPPSTQHQEIAGELYATIRNYIRQKGGTYKTFIAPFAVFLNKDPFNYVEPDISVICDPSKIDEKGCKGAPDWIIEVVSPSSISMDYNTKLFKYRAAKVREYWIVDAVKDMITVYYFETGEMNRYGFSDIIPSGIFEDLKIDFTQLDL